MKLSSVRLTIICIGALALTSSSSLAHVFPGSKNCPWANKKNKWSKYINGDYGDPAPFFSIQFNRRIGDIKAGACYTVRYLGKETWQVGGTVASAKDGRFAPNTTYGGNPLRYKINVWSAMFTFNEAGEVLYDQDKKLAGQMYCHIGSECWK